MTGHRFCPCWTLPVSLHDGHCCFRLAEQCPNTTAAEWQDAIDHARAMPTVVDVELPGGTQ